MIRIVTAPKGKSLKLIILRIFVLFLICTPLVFFIIPNGGDAFIHLLSWPKRVFQSLDQKLTSYNTLKKPKNVTQAERDLNVQKELMRGDYNCKTIDFNINNEEILFRCATSYRIERAIKIVKNNCPEYYIRSRKEYSGEKSKVVDSGVIDLCSKAFDNIEMEAARERFNFYLKNAQKKEEQKKLLSKIPFPLIEAEEKDGQIYDTTDTCVSGGPPGIVIVDNPMYNELYLKDPQDEEKIPLHFHFANRMYVEALGGDIVYIEETGLGLKFTLHLADAYRGDTYTTVKPYKDYEGVYEVGPAYAGIYYAKGAKNIIMPKECPEKDRVDF